MSRLYESLLPLPPLIGDATGYMIVYESWDEFETAVYEASKVVNHGDGDNGGGGGAVEEVKKNITPRVRLVLTLDELRTFLPRSTLLSSLSSASSSSISSPIRYLCVAHFLPLSSSSHPRPCYLRHLCVLDLK